MKGSERYKIVATVLEVMEKSGYDTNGGKCAIEETDNPDVWRMNFNKETINLDELSNTKKELGEKFNVRVLPLSRKKLTISIEATSEEFFNLIK